MTPALRRARSIGEAAQILRDHPDWRPICGGTDVLVQLRAGKLDAPGLVDLWGVLSRKIKVSDHEIVLGAGVTCADIAKSAAVRDKVPTLWHAAGSVGSPQIRNRATLGGNAGNASPAADMVTALVAEDARAMIQGPEGERLLPTSLLMRGPGLTALAPAEIITEFRVTVPADPGYSRFDKLGFRQAQVIAAVSLAVRAWGRGGGIEEIRLGWGAVAPTPVRSHAVEDALRGAALTPHVIEHAVAALAHDISPIDDQRASRAYRFAVAQSFLRRALEELSAWVSD